MRIEDGLVVFLALATSGVLLAGLAQALEGRRRISRPRRGREPGADVLAPVSPAPLIEPMAAPPPPIGQFNLEVRWAPSSVAPTATKVLAVGASPVDVAHADVRPLNGSSVAVPQDRADPGRAAPPTSTSAITSSLAFAGATATESDEGIRVQEVDTLADGVAAGAPTPPSRPVNGLGQSTRVSTSARPATSTLEPIETFEAEAAPELSGPARASSQPTSAASVMAPSPKELVAPASVTVPSPEDLIAPPPAAQASATPGASEPPVEPTAATDLAPGETFAPVGVAAPQERPAGPQVLATPAAAVDIAACLRAYEAGDYAAAGSVAAALTRTRTGSKRKRREPAGAPLEQVALWSALGLSRRSREDEAGATAAFASGACWAGAVAARRVPPSIGGLSPRLGRHLLTVGESLREGTPARCAVLRLAATWLAATAARAARDGDAAALAVRAGDGYAAAVHADLAESIARRDFAAAHDAIEDALGGIAVPDARRGELQDLLWTSLTGEIGRLVGRALHGAGEAESDDGMAALAAAAAVVAEVPPGTFAPERHEDLARRLWWAHMQLGSERRGRGELDAAATPLLHALELAAGDPSRERDAREAVALVIEALAAKLGEDIRDRLRRGDLGGAMVGSRRLSEVVDDALSRGLSPTDLAGALARRQEVLLELAEGRPA